MSTTFKMQIPPDKVEQTRKFFRERGGCLLWHNQEIGVQRSEIMTPATHEDGSPATPPHWAYGNSEPLQPTDIGVRTETILPPPEDVNIRVAIRRRYWGRDISDTGKFRAQQIAKRLGANVKWDWEDQGYGLAKLIFYTEQTIPFTLEQS